MTESTSFDRPRLERLRAAHAKALAEGHQEFIFDGFNFDLQYAKYLIEYLEGKLK